MRPPPCPAQDVESENVNVVKRLFKIQNLNASTIRTVMVADCGRFDSPDLLLDAGAPPGRIFDLGSEGEEEAAGPVLVRTKEGLRCHLDGLLDTRTQPQLAERALETKVAELLAQGRTKPPERSAAGAQSKLLIFTTGCLTYSPHQIGNCGPARPYPRSPGHRPLHVPAGGPPWPRLPGAYVLVEAEGGPWDSGSYRVFLTWLLCRHQADLATPDDDGGARAGRGAGL